MNGKARRAAFALQKMCRQSLPTKLALKMFDQLVNPIIQYGAIVWGPLIHGCVPKEKTLHQHLNDTSSGKGVEGDKIQMSYILNNLKLNNKAHHQSIRGETGALPTYIRTFTAAAKYLDRLECRTGSTLLDETLEVQRKMMTKGRKCWLWKLKNLMNKSEGNTACYTQRGQDESGHKVPRPLGLCPEQKQP